MVDGQIVGEKEQEIKHQKLKADYFKDISAQMKTEK